MQIENNPLWRAGKHPLAWGCLLLLAVAVLNNWPMAFFGFAWDDHGYVVRNYPLQDPLSLKALLWCLTAFAEANWHPVTWLALHLQFQLFGLNPGGYHVVNLLLHIADTLLLYALLWRVTRCPGKSLLVAALFCVHPLHIESVAWISEIKDVLSTLFFLLALHAYISYARAPSLGRYSLVGLLLALGLASKPMVVTAPCVMALMDYWPLGRWASGPQPAFPGGAGPRFPARRLILEKLPLLAMVAATCVLTLLAQRQGGAIASLSGFTLDMRLGNVLNSYVMYLWRMAWPWPLSFFYPYEPMPLWRVLACLAALAALSAGVWRLRRDKPYLLFGWLWHLGTLAPVIGLVQVGSQAMADRYTYIPSIGVFTAVVWLLDDLRRRLGLSFLLPAALSTAVVFAFMCLSLDYQLKWINEEELYNHGLSIDPDNVVALNNYGIILMKNNDVDNAIRHFKKNIDASPKSHGAKSNLVGIYLSRGDIRTALDYACQILRSSPFNEAPYRFLAQCLYLIQEDAAAEYMLRRALEYSPSELKNVTLLVDLFFKNKRYDEALLLIDKHLPQAYDRDPMKALMLWFAGRAYLQQGRLEESQAAFDKVLALHVNFPIARQGLARVALARNDIEKAVSELKTSLRLYPNDAATQALLGQVYLRQGRHGKAYVQLKRAMAHPKTLNPDDAPDAYLAMASLARWSGQEDAAARYAARAHESRTLLGAQAGRAWSPLLLSEDNGKFLRKQFPEAFAATPR
jgi:tetratricopeptide (TPR) repeat protein